MDLTIQREKEERNVDVFANNRSAPAIAIERPTRPKDSPPTAPLSIPLRQPPPPGVPAATPVPQAPPPPISRQPEPFDFGDLANPGRVNASPTASDVSGDSEPEYEEDGDVDFHPQGEEYPDSTVSEYVERPSPGFNSIEEERNALLFKIHRAIRGGMPVDKPERDTDIRDLRAIVGRIESEIALDRSIKFQRKMVVMLTSSIEWLNNKYSWAELDGWSDQVATSVSDYDDIFEELHAKYSGSMKIAPELRLVFALAASAFWFNLTKSMSKQLTNSLSGGGGGGGFDISSLLGSMMGAKQAAPTAAKPQAKPPQAAAPPPSPFPTPAPGAPTVLRKPMRGPTEGIGAMFGGMPPPVFEPNELPKMTDSRKRGRDETVDAGDDKSERLSDVVSSDGSSDLSDDSSSMGSSSGSEDDDRSIKISTVPVAGGRGRGRGGGRGGGGRGRGAGRGTKNVVTL